MAGNNARTRARLLSREKQFNTGLAERLFNRSISINQWQVEMRAHIVQNYKAQYVLGKGTTQLTQRDYGIIGSQVKKQYAFLNQFAQEIANGRYTVDQARMVAARQQMYAMSSNQAYERGKAEKYGSPQLPAYPGDGGTQCRTNCLCTWVLKRLKNGNISATWKLGKTEKHCHDCPPRAKVWRGLLFAPTGEPLKEIEMI